MSRTWQRFSAPQRAARWSVYVFIMAAIVASLVTYRSTTASAVTREERI